MMCEINKKTKNTRPHFHCSFRGFDQPALVDTGACLSIMDEETFRMIPGYENIRKLHNDMANAKAVNGSAIPIIAKYDMPFIIRTNGKSYRHPFYVCSSESNTILGVDFIKKYNVKVEGNKLTIDGITEVFDIQEDDDDDEDTPTGDPRLYRRRESLNPMSMTGVRVQTGLRNRTVFVEENSTKEYGTISCICTTDNAGVMVVPMVNKDTDYTTLKRDEMEGFFKLTEIESNKFDDALISAVTATDETVSDSDKRKRTFTSADVKKFKDKAVIKCPKEFRKRYEDLLLDYIDVFAHSDYDLGFTDKVSHKIVLKTDKPIYRKQFKIPLAHQEVIEGYVKDMLQANIVEVARSKYNSPIFCVLKKNGKLRPVVDLRAINKETVMDAYEIRDVRACLNAITTNNSKVFSTMDLASGFFQQNLEESSRPYTAFTVPGLGQFQFKVSCFGSHGAPSSFSTLMTNCLRGLQDVLSYIDDILAHTKTHTEMIETLGKIFDRLRSYNLRLSITKSTFGASETEYLGFRISDNGISPGPDKINVIRTAKPPETVRQIKQFLGLASFFREHISNFAILSTPLTKLTTKDSQYKKGPLPEEALKAFKEIQRRLCTAPILSYIR